MKVITRGTFRTSLTKIVKVASEYLETECHLNDENASRFEEIEEELVTLTERLTAVHEKLRDADKQVVAKNLIKPEDQEREFDRMAKYEDTAITHLAKLNNRLRKLRLKQNPLNNPADTINHNSSIPLVAPSHKSNIRLPKLQLKKFDGNMRDWMPFWDQFNSAVHQNNQLSAAEKFNYLEDVLSGAAKKAISGFTATSSCYDAAVALLLEQYGDTEKLIDNHMQKLISLSPVTVKSDVVGLRNLYNHVSTSIRSLTSLQVAPQRYDVMLKSILLRCLPPDMRVDYHRRKNGDSGTCKDDEAAAAETSQHSDDVSETQTSLYGMHDRGVNSILRFLKKEQRKSKDWARVGHIK
ncbi:uncharacterized protein LOC129945530 [Eupeodes corollae]|uniref:uncharacterized protein LOC129945530 n=1 Tax=Eupeodes corollae TaxID=290404 RepID=UPI002492A712|nr:uncharacterized protein LOC129945530 [Eupeodes corollae]